MGYFNTVAVALVLLLAILQLAHFSMVQQLTQLHADEAVDVHYHTEKNHKVTQAFFAALPMDTTGTYRVESNVLPSGNLSSVHDVTLVTQCSPSHLHHLVDIAERWTGPISVAVFVQGNEIAMMRRLVKQLRRCPKTLGEKTSVHFVYVEAQLKRLPSHFATAIQTPENARADCAESLAQLSKVKQKNYALKVPYPNNLLRNVARDNVMTQFVFVVDIDMVPSVGIRDDFVRYAHTLDLFALNKQHDKEVFVVPVFEARANLPTLPESKSGVVERVAGKKVRPFYVTRCDKCHRHTDYRRWLALPPSEGMTSAYEVEWRDAWEPFYIGRGTVPRYDERFKQYGFNRISNVCQLHMAGYAFHVMDSPFLVHKGFKEKGEFHADKDLENSINRDLFLAFRRELQLRYPDANRQCV